MLSGFNSVNQKYACNNMYLHVPRLWQLTAELALLASNPVYPVHHYNVGNM